MTTTPTRLLPMPLLDRQRLGSHVSTTYGPMHLPDRDALVGAFARLAAAGPASRVGLRFAPGAEHRRWLYRTDDLLAWADSCVTSLPAGADNDLDALLTDLHASPAGARPIRVHVADRHLVVTIDHALGDGRLSVAVPAALIDLARGADLPNWATWPAEPMPLSSALRHSFPRRRSLPALLAERRAVRVPPTLGASASTSTSARSRPAVVTEVGAVHGTRELRGWARAHARGASTVALLIAAIRCALEAEGIGCEPVLHMLYALHRYLPSGRHAAGNFVAGVDLAVDLTDALAVSEAIARAARVGRPLAAAAVSAARARSGRAAPAGPTSVPLNPLARLAVSFVGAPNLDAALPWAAPVGERRLWAHADPAGPDAITLLTSVVDTRVNISAAFYAETFDSDRVRRALRNALVDGPDLLDRVRGAGRG